MAACPTASGASACFWAGWCCFTCGAASCMAAANLPMLLAGRILQGAGAGCGVVLARAIARDVYGQDRVAQVIAYLTAAYVLGPMLAPPIGGQPDRAVRLARAVRVRVGCRAGGDPRGGFRGAGNPRAQRRRAARRIRRLQVAATAARASSVSCYSPE